ncbi:uncharacterized protein LOC127103013 [Lathyrus oleraceus]|uniref:uncharacterized protein LOC127103013 n=1 Tax=Pisum sativum TaxID=3888 RepID=UPI0021D3D1C5|nr:uncharacterized protein LOC127103013 [Pisum sativum]
MEEPPNFSYKKNNPTFSQNSTPQRPTNFQAQRSSQPIQTTSQKSNLMKIMEDFITSQARQNKELMNQNVHINELISQLGNKVDYVVTNNKMLETQICQSGTQYDEPKIPEPPKEKVVTTPEKQKEDPAEPEKQREKDINDKEARNDNQENRTYVLLPPYIPSIPYSQRLKQTKQDTQYKKLVKVIEKLHVEIPFTEAITQIPSYAKFLKDILTNKRKLGDPKPLEFNAIAENKLAKKQKDPGSFSIPCVLGKHVIDKALLDLGASVSLMPLVVCERLDLGDMQPPRMSLQLTDRSVKYPIGILEDNPVRIGQLYIPTDFVVMDIKEDKEIPILLSRPFLSSAEAMIDVKRGKMTFEVGDEKVEFIISKFPKAPTMDDSCCEIDIIDECITELDKE